MRPVRPAAFRFAVLGALLGAAPVPATAEVLARIDAGFAAATGGFVSVIFATLPGTDIPWIVGWLVAGALIFTLQFRFLQVRAFGRALSLVSGRRADPSHPGEVSHFQALTTALSGTVGLGNIAGVAVALSIGGPGATFWMIVAGFLGMATKFVECTLGVRYRSIAPDGAVSGGPMHYLERGFAERGLPGGRALALIFAGFCVLGSLGAGNMFQANQAAAQLQTAAGVAPWVTGLALAAITFAVILGGIRSIARVTSTVVPLMGVGYAATALAILVLNAELIPWALAEILRGAFTDTGVAGGVAGALIQGFRRAAFSNEAGIGSAAIAHAAARTDRPAAEGVVALLEPFIDTVLICTLTALVITVTGQLLTDPATGRFLLDEGGRILTASGASGGVEITSAAFGSAFAWAPGALAAAVTLFAVSTLITWSYYGLKAWTYLFGASAAVEIAFKLIFCAFAFLGAITSLDAVIDFSDAAVFAMAVANMIGLYALSPVVRAELAAWLAARPL